MPIIETKTGKRILKNPDSLWIVPYIYDSVVKDYVLGTKIYDISSIIGDSIVIEQEEGEEKSKTNEFTNETLVSNYTVGAWKFTAQCLDLQNNVLKALFSIYYNDERNIAVFQSGSTPCYALIRIHFSDESVHDVYLPKVTLNSKIMIQQMRSRGSQCNLQGTALMQTCAIIKTRVSGTTPGYLYNLTDIVDNTTYYSVRTPILLVPSDKNLLVFHHRDNAQSRNNFDEIITNPSSGEDYCERDRVVSDITPSRYSKI